MTQEWMGVTNGPRISRSHLGPTGPAQQPWVLGAAPMPAGHLPCGRGALRCVSGPNDPWRHGPGRAGGCHAQLTCGVTVRWARKGNPSCKAPPESSIQDGPAGPSRPSLPPVLAWPRSGSHTRHLPPSVGDAAGMSERSCCRRRRSGSGPQIPAGRGGWPSPGKQASAPPTAGARRRPPPLRTGSRAVRGDGRVHFNRNPGAGPIRWIRTRSPRRRSARPFWSYLQSLRPLGHLGGESNQDLTRPRFSIRRRQTALSPTSVFLWLCGDC